MSNPFADVLAGLERENKQKAAEKAVEAARVRALGERTKARGFFTQLGELVIAIDTSGSISQETLDVLCGELNGILACERHGPVLRRRSQRRGALGAG